MMLFAVCSLLPGLVLAYKGTSGGGIQTSHPIAELAVRGIRLDGLLLGERDRNVCYCSLACDTLAETFGPDQVGSFGEEAYDAGLARYWSAQQSHETRPRCFFHPLNAEEVSVAVLLSRATQCPFAVKGAGHAAFKGASNSDGGITIDFIHMSHVIPSADRKTVSIGPGNTWHNVYRILEKDNLTVVGGRIASVGVGGLTLGGGISFFSGQHGLACDNIVNYEIVVASGEILNVNAATNPDLFWALRGGGGNFGIVTQFVAKAIEQGPMWGGDVYYEMHSTKAALLKAMANYAEEREISDPKAALIVSFAYAQIYNMWVSVLQLEHSDPREIGSHPEVFNDFFLENAFLQTTRTTSQSDLALQLDKSSPFGFRNSYWTLTTYVDEKLVSDMVEIFEEETAPIANLTGIVPALSFQVMRVPELQAMTRNGGNAKGIGGGKRPLLFLNFAPVWALKSDDEAVLTACHNFITRSEDMARQRGLLHPYLYMNYASQWQDPIAGYGAENKARLLDISKKYDPEGVFQKLHPGYFKLGGAPMEW